MKTISVVIPVMDEVFNIHPIYQAAKEVIVRNNQQYEIIFVCDPSSDGTEIEIKKLTSLDSKVKGIFLADRAGQTESIRAGYEYSTGDAVISMDADFQDPPELIGEMINSWKSGALIVHTKRVDRTSDAFIYKTLTSIGYKFLSWITKGKIQNNVGDFRLIDKSILPLILKYKDPNPFWRGITSLAGVKSAIVPYKRFLRRSGSTKYSLKIGSPTIALRGMASFSSKPLEMVQIIGLFSIILCSILILVLVSLVFLAPGFPRGTPTIIVSLAILFSIQFASTAVIATYLSVLIDQTRRRPNYLVLPNE